jgi:hypothetical protein
MGGAAGGILDVRHVGDGYAIYGELDGFFAGSIYGGRVVSARPSPSVGAQGGCGEWRA